MLAMPAERQINEISFKDNFTSATVALITEVSSRSKEVEALMRVVRRSLETYISMSENANSDLAYYASNLEKAGELADLVASTIDLRGNQRLDLLLETNAVERLRMVLRLLETEIKLLQLEATIHTQVQSELDKSQREIYLREQISKLQKELGDGNQ